MNMHCSCSQMWRHHAWQFLTNLNHDIYEGDTTDREGRLTALTISCNVWICNILQLCSGRRIGTGLCSSGDLEAIEGLHLGRGSLREYSFQVLQKKICLDINRVLTSSKFAHYSMTMTMTMTMTMIMTRFIYVCYAERGLVRHGRPELLLANLPFPRSILMTLCRNFATFPRKCKIVSKFAQNLPHLAHHLQKFPKFQKL